MKMGQKQQKITKDMTMGEIVEKYPEVVPTLMGLGLHCIGCHVAGFESLEMGLKVHGMDDKHIKEAVKRLNDVIKKK
jgi:hybrid cluster-associated redox disulfide protein